MPKTPQQLGAVALYEPFRQAAGHRGLIDQIGENHAHLGSARSAFLTGSELVLPGVSGNYASVPDSAALSITGDIDVRFSGALADWSPASQVLVAKYGAAGQRSWLLYMHPSGFPILGASADGTSLAFAQATAAVPFADGSSGHVRVTRRQSDGRVQFFTSMDGAAWTQLGTNLTLSAGSAIFDSTTAVTVGFATGENLLNGRAFSAQVRNNVLDDGTGIRLRADFTAAPAGATSFTESSANAATVTVNATAADSNEPTFASSALAFATDDYVQVADAAALNFGAAMTAFVVVKAAAQVGRVVAGQYDTGANQRSHLLITDPTTGACPRVVVSADGGGTNVKDYRGSLAAFDNSYHAVTLTFSANTLKLFVDGVEDTGVTKATDATVNALHNSTALVTLGASLATGVPQNYFTGSLAAVALLPTALSASDVAHLHAHYRNTLAPYGITLPAGPATGSLLFNRRRAALVA